MIRRIAITGPESTGKSVLAEQLAARYGTRWVPEYAREYLDQLGRPYEEPDLLRIAEGQLAVEVQTEKQASGMLFCDTELTVIKIWSEVKYSRCAPEILELLESRRYDLYLLCDIDLPWTYDPLREHPERRRFLFDYYHRELTAMQRPFAVVQGTGSARLGNAVAIIEKFLH